MGLLSILQSHNARVQTSSGSNVNESAMLKKIRRESDVNIEYDDLVQQEEEEKGSLHPSFTAIPTFFKPKESHAKRMLRELAMQRTLRQREDSLPTQNELQQLYQTLCNCASGALGFPAGSKFDYELFKNLAQIVPPSCGQFFTASTFSSFKSDDQNKVPIEAIYKLIVRKVDLWRARVALARVDTGSCGWLSASQLEEYVHLMIPTVLGNNQCRLRDSDRCTYMQMAVAKFLFTLPVDPKRRVSIVDLLGSNVLKEFMQLSKPKVYCPNQSPSCACPTCSEHKNWFSIINFERVKRMWRTLDCDGDSMITHQDLTRFGSGTFTELFQTRLFQAHAKGGFIGFKGFSELLLACENKNTLPGLRYFFKILDLHEQGYLDALTVHAWVRTLGIMLMDNGHAIGGDDGAQSPGGTEIIREVQLDRHCTEVRGEVFDMVGSVHDNTKITVADLQACGVGGTVTSMLTEMRGFWAYENREAPMHQPDPEDEPPSPEPAPAPAPAPSSSYKPPAAAPRAPRVVNSGAFQSYGDVSSPDSDGLYDFGSDDDFEDDF